MLHLLGSVACCNACRGIDAPRLCKCCALLPPCSVSAPLTLPPLCLPTPFQDIEAGAKRSASTQALNELARR